MPLERALGARIPMPTKKRSEAVIVAALGLCGVLGAALIANWKKLFSPSADSHHFVYRAHLYAIDLATRNRVAVPNAQISVVSPAGRPGALSNTEGLFVIEGSVSEEHPNLELAISCPDCETLNVTRALRGHKETINEDLLLTRRMPKPDAGRSVANRIAAPCRAFLSGIVVNRADDFALKNVLVEAVGTTYRKQTDSAGHFEICVGSAQAGSSTRVRASLDGFEPWELDVELPDTDLTIQLKKRT